jgi:DNA processing protein
MTFEDGDYPVLLKEIFDPPLVLYVSGRPEVLNRPAVSIVGARKPTLYGRAVAGQLAGDLASRGIVIVSGLARGVDACAHWGAVKEGRTVAVMGSGLDVVYPDENRDLAAKVRERGAVVTEYPLDAPPLGHHFPLRNRIISGLSRAVIVVEASDLSGSLITAACALEQGRDVMAVPGPIVGARHRGSHALLRDGARLVASADDVLEELGWTTPPAGAAPTGSRHDPLLAHLAPGEDCDLDTLATRSGLPPTMLLSRLMELELAGLVERRAGGRFLRTGRH